MQNVLSILTATAISLSLPTVVKASSLDEVKAECRNLSESVTNSVDRMNTQEQIINLLIKINSERGKRIIGDCINIDVTFGYLWQDTLHKIMQRSREIGD
ncbi:hypothetical protein ACSYAD_27820 [Acaryochloris marina NIES-2412]|uniref:hypothetical protein n=1 Tax=Acaryochloris marina TaxID=155978 RepID=UPI004059AC78